MDFQSFVNAVSMPCCVISVEEKPGGWGEIRLLCANQPYRDTMGPTYYDGMPYHELVPRDNKFEDFCYRAAILGQRMHAYVETRALNCWTDQTLIPLAHRDGNIGYCQFIFEFTRQAEADRMALVSAGVSEVVIKACIALMGTDDFRGSVGRVLEDLLAFSAANACRVMLVDHDEHMAVNFCERVDRQVWPDLDTWQEPQGGIISYELICSWEHMIGDSNAVIVKNERDMEDLARKNPAWVNSMRAYGVTSLVLIPLRQDRNIIGYLYVVNFDVEKEVELKELIELLSFFLGSEISNYLLMRRLDHMSNTDALTGLNNRNAMIHRMRRLTVREEPESYGIVSMDLNGLKQVNDHEGHDAGDRLLRQAGELLRKVFYQEDLYRTGGDEFIAIVTGIEREAFERKLARLRRDVAKNADVSFAIGGYWTDGAVDVTTAFRRADQRMYEDKKAFYRDNPSPWHDARGFEPCDTQGLPEAEADA